MILNRLQKVVLLITICFFPFLTSGQSLKDSLTVNWLSNFRGRLQTGNLKQFVIANQSNILLEKEAFNIEISGVYEYVKVNGFNGVNDLWTYMISRYGPRKKIYPMMILYYGFAKSFRIDRSFVGGAGIGINIVHKSPQQFLQVNAFAGYMDFVYQEIPAISTAFTGILAKGRSPIIPKRAFINWELNSYFSPDETKMYGFQNIIRLDIPLVDWFSFSVSHSMIFNNIVSGDSKRLNTLMLFGVLFKSKFHH